MLKGYKRIAGKQSDDGVVELTEAFEDDSAFIEHLVEGLLPKSGSMVIGAKKKVGKNVFLDNLARSVVRGEPFLGRECRKGRVFYGSFDEPKPVTLERFEAIGLRDQPGFFFWPERGGPGPHWQSEIETRIRKYEPDLVIVDTLAKLASIQEINSYGEWNAAFAPLHRLSDELGFSLAVTVHNKKEGSGFDALAGSTAIGAGVDTIVIIERDLQDVRTIATEQRVGTDMERTILEMDRNTFELSIGPEQWLEKQRRVQQTIMDAIGAGALSLEQITAAVRHRTLAIKRALYAAVDAGFILREGTGTRGDPRLYRVRGNRDQETRKEPYPVSNLLGPGPIGDQETLPSQKFSGNGVAGPGKAPAGPGGTRRDQESGESDLLMKYAEERGLW